MIAGDWDAMLKGDDDEVQAEIAADLTKYATALMRNDSAAAVSIEKKYGLYGMSPEQVSTILAEMAKPGWSA